MPGRGDDDRRAVAVLQCPRPAEVPEGPRDRAPPRPGGGAGVRLARPDVRFEVVHEGRTLLDALATPGAERGARERIAQIFGAAFAAALAEIPALEEAPAPGPGESAELGESLGGFIGHPQTSRGHRQFVFVNRRLLRDRMVLGTFYRAVREEWRSEDFPALFLFLDLPPEEVDVNVHPQKAEVRFRDPGLLDRLSRTLRRGLERAPVRCQPNFWDHETRYAYFVSESPYRGTRSPDFASDPGTTSRGTRTSSQSPRIAERGPRTLLPIPGPRDAVHGLRLRVQVSRYAVSGRCFRSRDHETRYADFVSESTYRGTRSLDFDPDPGTTRLAFLLADAAPAAVVGPRRLLAALPGTAPRPGARGRPRREAIEQGERPEGARPTPVSRLRRLPARADTPDLLLRSRPRGFEQSGQRPRRPHDCLQQVEPLGPARLVPVEPPGDLGSLLSVHGHQREALGSRLFL
jgi:hypothetical protein